MMLGRSWSVAAISLCLSLLAAPLHADRSAAPDAGADRAPTQAPAVNNGAKTGVSPVITVRGTERLPRMRVPKVPDVDLLNVDTSIISGRLIIKLDDAARVAMNENGRMRAKTGCPEGVADCIAFINQLPVTIKPAITASRERQMAIEQKALQRSGRDQPNLSTLFYLESPSITDLKTAAVALNGMGDIEFVEWEPEYVTPFQPYAPEPMMGGELGACCLPEGCDAGSVTCEDFLQAECEVAGGQFRGEGSSCSILAICDFSIGACCINGECRLFREAICDAAGGEFLGIGCNCMESMDPCAPPACGIPEAGNCLVANGTPFCGDEDEDPTCCETVCEIDPFCCDETITDTVPGRGSGNWDSFCVFLAQNFSVCFGDTPDPFGSCNPLAGACFETNPSPGCSDEDCCEVVCTNEPFCCSDGQDWDLVCVQLAIDLCGDTTTPGDTPNFCDSQGYRTDGPYDPVPAELVGSLPNAIDDMGMASGLLIGYTGEGVDIAGLEQFGQDLFDDFGVGIGNGATGEGIRVAVVEHSAFPTHEDLVNKLNTESGQTIFNDLPSPLDGNHGTACLGIIGAEDNGDNECDSDEVGVVGMVPDAELWFFPIVSVEEGGRLINAMFSISEEFGPGDVASYSIGPGGCGTLASSGGNWTMLRLLADLGITNVISAGNDCCNLDGIAQNAAGESDVVIVGACSPGSPHCRLGFSNFCRTCDVLGDVHVNAWGSNVTTLGYGDLFNGDGPSGTRRYTSRFNGTSAAAPQIAAIATRLQGLAKQFYGIPLSPAQLRVALQSGLGQCAGTPVESLAGTMDGLECLGDFDFDAPPNLIGTRTDTIEAATTLIQFPFFDANGFLENVEVVQGSLQNGNDFSLDSQDGNYFTVLSTFQDGRNKRGGVGTGGKALSYIAAGQTVDIIYTAHTNFQFLQTLTINLEHQPFVGSNGAITFAVAELFDWTADRWTFVGISVNNCPNAGQGGDFLCGAETFTIENANRFVNPTNRNVLIRTYFVQPGGPSASFGDSLLGPTEFPINIDLLGLGATETVGFNEGGVGFGAP